MYTTAPWLHAFFEAVATADQNHFSGRDALAAQVAKDTAAGPPARPIENVGATRDTIPGKQDDLDAALREEGL